MARKNSRGASPVTSRRQVPGWVWLFTGVVTGLFVAFLVHLASIPPREDPGGVQMPTAATEDAEEEGSGPRFDFYAVLPQMEVILPKRDRDDDASEQTPAPRTPGDRGTELADGESYMLQAGSFRNEADADRRRAKLILEGFEVKVQRVKLDTGDTWHRVMIGPYTDTRTLHEAQDQLAEGGIEVLPIRARSPEG